MRIAVAGKVLDNNVGGNSRYAKQLYGELVRAGIDVNVLRTRSSLAYRPTEALAWPLMKSLGQVIHYPADTGPLIAPRLPTVGTVHGVAALHTTGVRSPRAEALWLWRTGRLVDVADHIITVSASSRRDIIGAFDCSPRKISVIYHGVDHDRFRPTSSAQEDAALLKQLSLPDRFVVYVGNIEPRKNVGALIDASRQIFLTTGCRMVIAGAPAWDSDTILAKLKAAQYVTYLGRVADDVVISLLRRAKAFCFPSLYEGFGLPVLEAMACGTPVVCSANGSLTEVAGDAAVLLEETTGEAVAQTVIELLQDPNEQLRRSKLGLAQAERFSWHASAMSHLTVFRQVIDGHSGMV